MPSYPTNPAQAESGSGMCLLNTSWERRVLPADQNHEGGLVEILEEGCDPASGAGLMVVVGRCGVGQRERGMGMSWNLLALLFGSLSSNHNDFQKGRHRFTFISPIMGKFPL